MEPSRTQQYLGLTLTLLLPLYTRTTTMYEFSLVLIVTAVALGIAHQAGKPIDLHLAKRFALAALFTLIANRIADFAVLGPWMRLSMAHLFTWDMFWYLFPNLATEHRAHVRALRIADPQSLLVVLPLVHAAITTIYITRNGYLNANDSQYLAVIYGFLLWYAIFDPMHHLTVAIWRCLTTSLPASVKARVASDLMDVGEGLEELCAEDAEASHMSDTTGGLTEVKRISKPSLASMIAVEKENHWDAGTVPTSKPDDGMVSFGQVLPRVSEVQARPSTRRRG